VLKGQDVVVLLRLMGQEGHSTVRQLADATGLDVAGTHRALHRLAEAGLYDPQRGRVLQAPAEEFLVHAVKYVFPAQRGPETRGVLTAWAAPPLSAELAATGELPPVWPHPRGTARGIALEPLHPKVPDLAMRDAGMARRLALVDAIRAGGTRIRRLAEQMLLSDLTGTALANPERNTRAAEFGPEPAT
jgi:hypothetical protein